MSSIEKPRPRVPVTTEAVVRTAAHLFRVNGYVGTTTRELARELGIQPASLYHHISTKEEVLFEISLRSLDRITHVVSYAISNTAPESRLRVLIETHLETALADQDLHATMLTELKHLNLERRRIVLRKRAAYEALVDDQIKQGQEAGYLRQDISSRHLVLTLLNMLNWTIFWFRKQGNDSPRELASVMATIFIEGTISRQVSIAGSTRSAVGDGP